MFRTLGFTSRWQARCPACRRTVSLAELGRKEIRLAEHEMPGLMAVRRRYATEKPLANTRIMGSLHMTVQTAVYQSERRFVLAFSAQDLLHPGLLGLGCALVVRQAPVARIVPVAMSPRRLPARFSFQPVAGRARRVPSHDRSEASQSGNAEARSLQPHPH